MIKYYENMITGERIEITGMDAELYALEQLGMSITPLEKDGTYTEEQITVMCDIRDWFYSDNWIETEVKEEEEIKPKYDEWSWQKNPLWEVR